MPSHYHKNPRQITKKQFAQLREWLDELGDLGGIVHDLNSDEIIGGNQRLEAMGLMDAAPTITQTFDPPTKQGTVALGYYEHGGELFGYRAVRWNERQCEKANIVANKAGGAFDFDILANQFEFADLVDWGFDEAELVGGGAIVPDFQPVDESEQPRLDQKSPVTCPECGTEFIQK